MERRIHLIFMVANFLLMAYLREIIEQGIGDMEGYYLGAEVLERVRKGQEQVHSAADVRRDLGLDD